ncbi:MAG: hypothetical protein ABI797_00470 [Chloroflexota bacterium]
MTDHDASTAEDPVAEHATDSHMDAHTTLSDDDHGHAEEALGPIDWRAWGLAVLGALSGVVVLAGFWVALN